MKAHAISALALIAACATGSAGAQTGQVYEYQGHDGSLSPPSTLRMTVTPAAAPAPPPVRDTPQSVRIYTQCRDDADREATSSAKMREAVGRCLQELNQRRAQGQ